MVEHNGCGDGASPDWSTVPQLVLWSIVEHVEDTSDLASMRLTCRRWSKTVTQNAKAWRVRGPVARFHWDYLRGTLYTLCPVVTRMVVGLSNRVSQESLDCMFADLNWWSRLRELVLVAMRPLGSGLFGPGLSTQALVGVSKLRGLQALTTEGCDSQMTLHAALCCPQLTKLVVRSRQSPLGPTCRVSNRFLELLAAEQRAISQGQPRPPWPRRRQHSQGQEEAGVGGEAAEGGAGGGAEEAGTTVGGNQQPQPPTQIVDAALNLELQLLFAEAADSDGEEEQRDGDVEMGEAGEAGAGAKANAGAGAKGGDRGPAVTAGTGAAGTAVRQRRVATSARGVGLASGSSGGGAGSAGGTGPPYSGLRHLELDSDCHMNDAATLMSLLDPNTTSSSLGVDRVNALLSALPSLEHISMRRVPLDETAVLEPLSRATRLTELHAAVQDGRGRGGDRGVRGAAASQTIRVLKALAGSPHALSLQPQPPPLPPQRLNLGPTASWPADDEAVALWYGPQPAPGRPVLHLYVSGANSDTPTTLLDAMLPLVPRLRTLFFSHRSLSTSHMGALGRLTSVECLGLSLSYSSPVVRRPRPLPVAQPGGATRRRLSHWLRFEAQRLDPTGGDWRGARRGGAGGLAAAMATAARSDREPPDFDFEDGEHENLDAIMRGSGSDSAMGAPGGGPPWDSGGGGGGLGLGSLQRLTELRELHIQGPLEPVGLAARVAAGLAALATHEPQAPEAGAVPDGRQGLGAGPGAGLRGEMPPRLTWLTAQAVQPATAAVTTGPTGAPAVTTGPTGAPAVTTGPTGAPAVTTGPTGAPVVTTGPTGAPAVAAPPPARPPPPPRDPRPSPRGRGAEPSHLEEGPQPWCFRLALSSRHRLQRHQAAAAAAPGLAADDDRPAPSGSQPTPKAPALQPQPSPQAWQPDSQSQPQPQPQPQQRRMRFSSQAARADPISAPLAQQMDLGAGPDVGPVTGAGTPTPAAGVAPPGASCTAFMELEVFPSAPMPAPLTSSSAPPLAGTDAVRQRTTDADADAYAGTKPPLTPTPAGPALRASGGSQSASPEMQALAAALALAAAEWDGPDADGAFEAALLADGHHPGQWPPGLPLPLPHDVYIEDDDDLFEFLGGPGDRGAGRGAGRGGRGGGRGLNWGGRGGGRGGLPMALLGQNPLLQQHQQLLTMHQELVMQERELQRQLQRERPALEPQPQRQRQQDEYTVLERAVQDELKQLCQGQQLQPQPRHASQGQPQQHDTQLDPWGSGGGGGGSRGRTARGGRVRRGAAGSGGGGTGGSGLGRGSWGLGGIRARSRGWLANGQHVFGSCLGGEHDAADEHGEVEGAAGQQPMELDEGTGAMESEDTSSDEMELDMPRPQRAVPAPTAEAATALATEQPHPDSQPQPQPHPGPLPASAVVAAADGAVGAPFSQAPGATVPGSSAAGAQQQQQQPQALRNGPLPQPWQPAQNQQQVQNHMPYAAQALEDLARDRQMLRRAVLSLQRPDLAALRTHGPRLEALTLHYIRMPPNVVSQLAAALPRLRRLSLRWANDQEQPPGGVPCGCSAAGSGVRPGGSAAASTATLWGGIGMEVGGCGGGNGAGCSGAGAAGRIELAVLPPLLESLELGGPVMVAVTAADLGAACGSSQSPGPVWAQLRRLVLTEGICFRPGDLSSLLNRSPYLTELQLLRPRWLKPTDLASLEYLDRLRTLVVDLDSRDLECRDVRLSMARGISRVARLTQLQELRWNVPDPPGMKRRAGSLVGDEKPLSDPNVELCQELPKLTALQRLSLLSLPSCRHLLPRLEDLQALRHLPFLELSS